MAALAQGFLIRPARTEDVPAVAKLEAEVFPDPWPAHLYLQEVGQPLRFQRVVYTEAGYLAAYLFACWQVDELHVLKVATHPLHEGKGLATSLLAEAREEAQRARARGLVLEVRTSNRRAFRLYRWLGYDVIGRRPRYYTDGEDALVMFQHCDPTAPG
ncbi:MAG TPA: ribosomal protein S18-alanine N-acetyltransferase [Thermoanaerobaculaceae bacterium]|nr:ribosomal protein S18-alanine N-acetyltransferase [Thermoanaerobaculaceae bacterium]